MASEPGFRHPVLVIQSNDFNASKINTVIAVAVTSNLALALAPGNVSLSPRAGGLGRDSVINISQIITLDKLFLAERAGRISTGKLREVENGIRMILDL